MYIKVRSTYASQSPKLVPTLFYKPGGIREICENPRAVRISKNIVAWTLIVVNDLR